MKKTIFALVAVSLSLLLSFGIMEAVLRVIGYKPAYINPLPAFHKGDPTLGWVGVPSFSARFKRGDFDVVISMDESGFRKSQAMVKPGSAAKTVMFLGDSFTWGWGLEQGRVFTDVLQDALGPDYQVVNRGVNAYGTVQQKLMLEREIGPVKPKLVGLVFFMNDLDDNVDPDDFSRPYCTVQGGVVRLNNCPVTSPLGGTYSPVIRKSYAASLVTYYGDYFIRVVKQSLADAKAQDRESTGLEPDLVAIQEYTIGRMKQICGDRATEFFIVYAPFYEEMSTETESVYHATMRRICDANGIDFVDLVPEFRKLESEMRKRGESLFFRNDRHWTATGHHLAASIIEEYIRARQ